MDISSGFNNTVLKQNNRGLVYKLIATSDGISRTELAEASGLTKMAVSYIVAEFLEKGLVVETEYTGQRKLPRKPVMLRLSQNCPNIAGVLVHRNYIAAVLCDCQLNVLRSSTIRIQNYSQDELLEAAFRVTDAVMAGRMVAGIGIGSIGPVDIANGIILNPPDFFGIQDLPIVQMFRQRYELPVFLDYHYNCAAMAEKYFGKGQTYRNFLFLGITEGLGMGIVADNKLYSGFTGLSSEIGHVCIDRNGPLCSCGNRGCMGSYLNFNSEEGILSSMECLAIGMAGICNQLNPEAIIVGDELARLQDAHLQVLEDQLNQRLLSKHYRRVKIVRSYRCKDLEASSCAMNVICRIFDGSVPL